MRDPFDILQSHEPVDVAEIEAYASAHADDVKHKILASPRLITDEGGASRGGRPWRRVAAVAASIAVVAAAAFVVTRPAATTEAISCYADVDLDADRIGLQPEVLDVAACADVWSDGSLTNTAIVPAGMVPPLLGCIDDRGTVAVFPTSNAGACSSLNLAVFDESPAPAAGSIVMVQEKLRSYVASGACVSVVDAATEARAQLAAEGLTDWTVDEMAPTADRPCASFGVDDATMTILIVPVPRP